MFNFSFFIKTNLLFLDIGKNVYIVATYNMMYIIKIKMLYFIENLNYVTY